MTLPEILRVFDEVRYDVPHYEDQPGNVICCGRSVVMWFQQKVYCTVCGRTAQVVGRQWMVTEWGKKGIKINGW